MEHTEDKEKLKRTKDEQEQNECDKACEKDQSNPCSLMQSKRVNKYNSKKPEMHMIQKEDEEQSNLKKAKLNNDDVQTGSTYPYSNKDNGNNDHQIGGQFNSNVQQ